MPHSFHRPFGSFVLALGAGLLLVQLVPLTAFIIDPAIAAWAPRPWTPMPSRHACSTAYWTACEAAARGGSLYDERLSSMPQRNPAAPRIPRPMGPVHIDPYEYPPSFLPVPALLRQITPRLRGLPAALVRGDAGGRRRRRHRHRPPGRSPAGHARAVADAVPADGADDDRDALVSLSWGIGFMPPLVNAPWTTLQTIAAFALVTITCSALRDPATSPARLSAAPERVTA